MDRATNELTELVRRHQGAVCAVAYAVLRDRARSEEIAQEAFLIAWRDRRREAWSSAWLCGIARNLARNAARRRKEQAMTDEPIAREDPRAALIAREEAAQVRDALDALPERDREAVALYYRGDESMRGVADALGISEPAARELLYRAREKLRDRLAAVEADLRATRPGPAFTGACVALLLSRAGRASAAGGTGKLLVAAAAAVAVGTAGVAVAIRAVHDTPQPRAVHDTPQPRAVHDTPHARDLPRRVVRARGAATGDTVEIEMHDVPAGVVLDMMAARLEVPLVRDAFEEPLDLDLHGVAASEVLDLVIDAVGAIREDVDGIRVIAGGATDTAGMGDTLVTVRFEDTPISDAIAAIPVDVPVAIARDLEVEVTLELEQVPAGGALAQVLKAAHLGYEPASGYRITVATTDPATAP